MTRHPALRWRIAIVVGLAAIVLAMSRGLWFIDDDWDYLTNRTGGDLDSYLQPHAGHWTLWTVPTFRFLYRLFGMDYFPWYHVPRFIALIGLALLLWKAFEKRGAPPLVALMATSVFVVLDTSAGHRSISIGSYLVLAALIVVAFRLVDDDPPSGRNQLICAGALLVAVCAFSTGPVVLGSFLVVAVFTRRIRFWWLATLPALVVFGLWQIGYGPDRSQELTVGDLPGVPFAMLEVLGRAVSSLTGLPTVVGIVGAVALLGLLGWWGWKREYDRFDTLALVTAGAFLVVTAALRVVADFPVEDRYAFLPIVTIALVVVPRIPSAPRTRQAIAVGTFGVVLLAVNLVGTHNRSDELADVAAERRVRVETAAALLADGEPAIEDSWVTVPLTVAGLRRLVDDGWDPPVHQEALIEARGLLRIGLGPTSIDPVPEPDPADCSTMTQGDRETYTLDGPATLVVRSQPPTQLIVRWTEGDVIGERTITWAKGRGAFHGRLGHFPIAGPEGDEAELRVTANRAHQDVDVCLTDPDED